MCVKFIEERILQAFEMSLKYKSGSTIYHNSAFIECIETINIQLKSFWIVKILLLENRAAYLIKLKKDWSFKVFALKIHKLLLDSQDLSFPPSKRN